MIRRKCMAILLISTMILGTVAENPVMAAKKPKINKKKVTLRVGEKVQLKVKNCKKIVKWSSSKKKVATVSKKGIVVAKKKGTAKIIAKVAKKKYVCKVTVKKEKKIHAPSVSESPVPTAISATPSPSPSATPTQTVAPQTTTYPTISLDTVNGELVYDMAQNNNIYNPATGQYQAPPITCPYSEFKKDPYRVWLCSADLYDVMGTADYRGVELKYSIMIKNTSGRDLTELGFCLNSTKGGEDGSNPYMFHVIDRELREQEAARSGKVWNYEDVISDAQHKNATVVEQKIHQGSTYIYHFTYTIPEDAMNEEVDPDTGYNLPLRMYIPNVAANSPYQDGDEITILDCKISVSDGTDIIYPVEYHSGIIGCDCAIRGYVLPDLYDELMSDEGVGLELATDECGMECMKLKFTDVNQRIFFRFGNALDLSYYTTLEIVGNTPTQLKVEAWDRCFNRIDADWEENAKMIAYPFTEGSHTIRPETDISLDDFNNLYPDFDASSYAGDDGIIPAGTPMGPMGRERDVYFLDNIKTGNISDIGYVSICVNEMPDMDWEDCNFHIYGMKFDGVKNDMDSIVVETPLVDETED